MSKVRPKIAWPNKARSAFTSTGKGNEFYIKAPFIQARKKAAAFKTVAERTLRMCSRSQKRNYPHELFYPIAFLYRHSLELWMKDIIQTGTSLGIVKSETVKKALEGHSLGKLWPHAREVLAKRWKGADPTPLDNVEGVIKEFDGADPNGQVFRYDYAKGGMRHSANRVPENISLANLRRTMAEVSTFLECTASALEDDLETLRDGAR